MIELIKKYISNDPISYVHIEELLNSDFDIIYASDNGFIIHDLKCDFIYISFSDCNEMKDILSKYHYDTYIAYEKEIVEFYGDLGDTTNLIEYVYTSNNKFDIDGYDIRTLGMEYLDFLNSVYKAIGPDEDNSEVIINKELIGLFVDNKLVGFAGRHPEGCLGLLRVFEEYRQKGYGKILEKAKINDLINRKQKVFCEVLDDNIISQSLQESLGFIKGNKKLYWKLNGKK